MVLTLKMAKEPDIKELQMKLMELESKISKLERTGARVRPSDLFSMSFFAAVNSAIIVISILLIISVRSNIL